MSGNKSGSHKFVIQVRLKVKDIAESKGRSMVWLANHAEVQYDTIRGIFNNPGREVSVLTLAKIARALGCEVQDLFDISVTDE
jgi:DNA-binding Xre family transcriptional regulator